MFTADAVAPPRSTIPSRRHVKLTGLTLIVAALVLSTVGPAGGRTGDGPPAATPATRFVADRKKSLQKLRERLANVSAAFLDTLDPAEPADDDEAIQSLRIESAKANLERAVLAREAAEIALKEYTEGIFKREKMTCEREQELAQAELESADAAFVPGRERFAKIKAASTGSVADLAAVWQFETGELMARLKQKAAQFRLEQAKYKLKSLVDSEFLKRTKELKADIEKMRSETLATKATYMLEQVKLNSLQKQAAKRLPDDRKRILSLLDRAITIEEQLSARLDKIESESPSSEVARKEVTDLARQLEDIVEQVQSEEDARTLGRLKSNLRRLGNG